MLFHRRSVCSSCLIYYSNFLNFISRTVDAPTGIINVIDGKAGSIPRADVAQFCLDAVRVEDFPYIGKAACISSVGGTAWKKDRSKAARGEM